MSIVSLLNEVFPGWGEEDFFEWKYKNPFGESIILVEHDVESTRPIAARMFMAWTMKNSKNEKYDCFQATDSATHPKARGKGLFSKLTNEALQRSSNIGFIFNFPNQKSLNIYLRLGWCLEESKKALYLPLYNIKRKKESKLTSSHVDDLLKTDWGKDEIKWRLKYLRVERFTSSAGAVFLFRKINYKFISVADIVYTEEKVECSDVAELLVYLKKCKHHFIRYIGFNTKFETILTNGYLINIRYGVQVNSVSYNKPEGYKLRLEMMDSDYIK